MGVQVFHGDMLEVLAEWPDACVDSCVCDPPYHLTSIVKRFGKEGSAEAKSNGATGVYRRASKGFMGKEWDGGDVAFQAETWRQVLRVLKPGGHLIAFSGTRTYHRMAVAVEDAGFEIRDMISWLYGSGFPKSHNVGKSSGDDTLLGWGTALKPACEPIVLARKPLSEGSVAANVLLHGTGAVHVGACRVESVGGRVRGGELSQTTRYTSAGSTNFAALPGPRGGDPNGRWPANVIHDGSPEVLDAFPDAPGQQAPVRPDSGTGQKTDAIYGAFATNSDHSPRGDAGSAARFFYSAKATKADRLASKHPTVKPVDLMAYLVRLVTPPAGTVLDPFAGSGTTGMACMREGFDCLLVEREAEYVADIRARLDHVSGKDSPLFACLEAAE